MADEAETKAIEEWERIRLPKGEWFFNLRQRLGRPGGFGEVFVGKGSSGEPVAVKRLKISAGEAAHRELEIVEELSGRSFKHVMAVLDSGEDAEAGGFYVVMPRADSSLDDALKQRRTFPEGQAISIIRQVAEGLTEISQIVHRDLKPPNILFHEGAWKITDFSIARLVEGATSTDTVREFLSQEYAAPEQWRGERATAATDLYALACVGYALLRGSPPFSGPTREDYRHQHLTEMPATLENVVDSRLRTILLAALRKQPTARRTLTDLKAVLDEIQKYPAHVSPVIAELRAVNAAEAERISAAEAAEASRLRGIKERADLTKNGEAILGGLVKRLEQIAHANAPDAVIRPGPHQRPDDLIIEMGTAGLRIQLDSTDPQGFQLSRWDVLAFGGVRVNQRNPFPWSHGATLWYMKLPDSIGYRWYEASYKWSVPVRTPEQGPMPIQEMGLHDFWWEADRAAAMKHEPPAPRLRIPHQPMTSIELVSPPIPIDDEDSETFYECWLARLVNAYRGTLRT